MRFEKTNGIINSLAKFTTFHGIHSSERIFVLGWFINIDLLESHDVYCCKANLESPVSKLYGMIDIN